MSVLFNLLSGDHETKVARKQGCGVRRTLVFGDPVNSNFGEAPTMPSGLRIRRGSESLVAANPV